MSPSRQTQRQRCARHGFSVELPADWEVLLEQPELPALISRDPRDDGGQHPSFLVDVQTLRGPMTLVQYELEQQRGLPEQLPGYQCLEISQTELAGTPALYRLCDYLFEAASMTGIQWEAIRGSQIVTLSATCRTGSYPDLAAVFDEIAATFAWDEEAA